MEMRLTDFFDIKNKEHLKEFRYLNEIGTWSDNFLRLI